MANLRVISVLASFVVLCACAGSNASVKRDAATSENQDNSACLKSTGSRIPNSGTSCSAFGRSYSSDDINRTGSTNAAGELRLLDPSITSH
jgi:hypothetical protein